MSDTKELTKNITAKRRSEQMITLIYKEGEEHFNKESFEKLLTDLSNIYDNFFN